jgi:hypothetical protein
MKVVALLASALLLSGCYTTVVTSGNPVAVPTPHGIHVEGTPVVRYSPYSPPVVVQYPNCYMRTVPQYGYVYGNRVVIGSTQRQVCDY